MPYRGSQVSRHLTRNSWSTGFIPVDYAKPSDRLATQLHECLHFLNVDDYYVVDDPTHPAKPCSTRDDCVMLCGVNSVTVCDSVLAQISNFQEQ
jgi:hypothetical protein